MGKKQFTDQKNYMGACWGQRGRISVLFALPDTSERTMTCTNILVMTCWSSVFKWLPVIHSFKDCVGGLGDV